MSKITKIIILSILFVISTIVFVLFITKEIYTYAIILGTVSFILLIILLAVLFTSNDPNKKFNKALNKIIKTYGTILVKSKSSPSVDDRNIIRVESFEDLMNAQLEIRKPIYYTAEEKCCSFVLFADKDACIYILKQDETIISELEDKLEKEKNKKAKKDDYSMLNDLDKTSIIVLDNMKSFKVSPVRKKEEVKEEPKEEIKKSDIVFIND